MPVLYHVYLKVWIGHTFRDLFEQWLLDFLELCWLNNIQNLLDFTQEHHLMIMENKQEAGSNMKSLSETVPSTLSIDLQYTSFWLQVLGQNFRSPRITCTDDT